jgi:hypothetical protein
MLRNEASKADLYLLRKADLEIGLKWYRNNIPNAVNLGNIGSLD